MHWQSVMEIINTMEKVAKDANKVYDLVVHSTDNVAGPSPTKMRLLAELEDLDHTTLRLSY